MRAAIGIGIVVVVATILLMEFGSVKICDGSYDLSVTVKSTSSAPLAAVSCEAFGRLEQAEWGLEYLPPPESKHWSASAEPFTGEPLIVSIPLSFRESGLGRTWGDSQFRGLLVIVRYRDGKRMGQAIEIPHRRDSRSVRVEFP
jgi:hypothetical protein